LLTDDAILKSDGDGKVQAARNPLYGASNVARFLLGVVSKSPPNAIVQVEEVNDQPAIVVYIDEQLYGAFSLDVIDEQHPGHLYHAQSR
jgi:RNA polymerase sigma-70 factor (ECF subfamily)